VLYRYSFEFAVDDAPTALKIGLVLFSGYRLFPDPEQDPHGFFPDPLQAEHHPSLLPA
jgi:hypothetical protein